jgi:tetratricopeptide (TPR) repeat protein
VSTTPSHRPPAGATGTFAKTPFSHLLLYVHDQKLSGTLELATPDRRSAAVFFIEGKPVKARTSEPVAYLGRVLLERGVLTEEQLNRSLAELAKEKAKGRKLHGELLLAQGLIDRAKLQAGLRDQLTRKLRYVATLPVETAYAYYEAFDVLASWGDGDQQPIDPMPIIWAILRSDPPEEQLQAALGRIANAGLRLARGTDFERLGLTEQERVAMDLLRTKPMRVSSMAVTGVLSERAARVLAYALLVTKQVDLVRASEPPPKHHHVSTEPPPVSSARGSDVLKHAMKVASKPKAFPVPGHRTPTHAPGPEASGQGTQPPPGLSPDLAARKREILDRATSIERADYFMMLELARDASHDEVEAAFFSLAKRWHPDRLPQELASVRDACSRVFARMSEAHATLVDKDKRARYMRLLADGSGTPEAQDAVAKVIEATTIFQKAEICFKRNDFVQAEGLVRKACEIDPTQAEYLAMLAWLTAQKPENQTPERTQECIQLLDKAVSLNERCEKALLWRGMLLKRNGSGHTAMKDFKAVVELNPRNIDAARELRLHEMRSTGKPPKVSPARTTPTPNQGQRKTPDGGLFGKLFKK